MVQKQEIQLISAYYLSLSVFLKQIGSTFIPTFIIKIYRYLKSWYKC